MHLQVVECLQWVVECQEWCKFKKQVLICNLTCFILIKSSIDLFLSNFFFMNITLTLFNYSLHFFVKINTLAQTLLIFCKIIVMKKIKLIPLAFLFITSIIFSQKENPEIKYGEYFKKTRENVHLHLNKTTFFNRWKSLVSSLHSRTKYRKVTSRNF